MSLNPTNAWYDPPTSIRARARRTARIAAVVALLFAAAFVVTSVPLVVACSGSKLSEACGRHDEQRWMRDDSSMADRESATNDPELSEPLPG